MSEELEEQDYYHYDFTTASEWEIFIARLEEVIHLWKLPQLKSGTPLLKKQFFNGIWEKQSEKILFADSEFALSRYHIQNTGPETALTHQDEVEDTEEGRCQFLDDMMSHENDFLPPISDFVHDNKTFPSMLVRWYGLRDFMLLSPMRNQIISTESKVKILLSSIIMAINNSGCNLPVFIQVHQPEQMFYLGEREAKGFRTEFEMVHLHRTPPHCKHLTGLLNLFKTKIHSPVPIGPVSLSVRFTYVLQNWTSYSWSCEPPDFDALKSDPNAIASFVKLPFGTVFDPVSELHLYATWPQLLENAVVDSESYSDFEPLRAPLWSVRAVMAERLECLLGEHLTEFVQLCSSKRSMYDLLGDLVDKAGPDLSSSLNLLTESRVPTISKVIKKATGKRQDSKGKNKDGPLPEELLMPILYYLFPDAEENQRNPYPDSLGKRNETEDGSLSQPTDTTYDSVLSGLKAAPRDSLLWRLAVMMSHVVHTLGGIRAAAHLWYEFVQEMRYRWEKTIIIPGVSPGFPDPRTCLLHQKLQLLNCCVSRKQAREHASKEPASELSQSDSDSEDEFFDCSDEEVSGDVDSEPPAAVAQNIQKHSLWNQPVGRLRRHGNLRLVATGEHLYVPLTQDPIPKTEDQVEEDAEVLLQLGTDAQGAELRARMMSASLLSDMESFKAANPGAIVDDFIRWYSPRDWIEEPVGTDEYGQRKGSLSARMQIKGNTWMEVWEAAKPVPARRQKRLFDDTREAEKVLHFLDSRLPCHIAQLLMPMMTGAVIAQLMEQQPAELTALEEKIQFLVKSAERLTRNPNPNMKKYEDFAGDVVSVEVAIAQFQSIQNKFGDPAAVLDEDMLEIFLLGEEMLQQFMVDLTSLAEVEVGGGPRGHIRGRISTMFSEAQKVAKMITQSQPLDPSEDSWTVTSSHFPRPASKEFMMRVWACSPAPTSPLTPQRLYATLKKDEFRMAGAFTHATNFY